MSHPLATVVERSDAPSPPSHRGAVVSSAVPATKEEWTAVLKNNTSCLKGIVVSRQGGVPETAQYTDLVQIRYHLYKHVLTTVLSSSFRV